jgi:hypothetical protein
MSLLGGTVLTVDESTVIIPDGCNYVVALCTGSVDPPYLNGNLMETYCAVPATNELPAVGIHVSTFPTGYELPYAWNGNATVTMAFLDDTVCTRAVVVQGNSAGGTITGSLPTSSTTDMVFGIVVGEAGQVTLTGGGTALTLLEDTSLRRIGYITPGTGSLACVGTSALTAIGYLIPGVPIWHGAVLIEAGHYESVTTTHYVTFVWVSAFYGYEKYIDGSATGHYYQSPPEDYTYETHSNTWIKARYTTGYWEYPPDVYIPNSPGHVSAAFIATVNVMIGGIYVSRPLFG